MTSIEKIQSIDWSDEAGNGISKADFELLALAVSAINGCGTCVASHERQLRQHGLTREAVQSAVRIAATVHSVARVLEGAVGEHRGRAAA